MAGTKSGPNDDLLVLIKKQTSNGKQSTKVTATTGWLDMSDIAEELVATDNQATFSITTYGSDNYPDRLPGNRDVSGSITFVSNVTGNTTGTDLDPEAIFSDIFADDGTFSIVYMPDKSAAVAGTTVTVSTDKPQFIINAIMDGDYQRLTAPLGDVSKCVVNFSTRGKPYRFTS